MDIYESVNDVLQGGLLMRIGDFFQQRGEFYYYFFLFLHLTSYEGTFLSFIERLLNNLLEGIQVEINLKSNYRYYF